MAIANPRIHMICGICGSKDELRFEISRDSGYINEGEPNEKKIDEVYISCGNCASLTELGEVIKYRSKTTNNKE
jgi:hypothetical protein